MAALWANQPICLVPVLEGLVSPEISTRTGLNSFRQGGPGRPFSRRVSTSFLCVRNAAASTCKAPMQRLWCGSRVGANHYFSGHQRVQMMPRSKATSQVVINRLGLQAALARRGWSFRDLAKVSGLSSSTIALINRGAQVSPSVLAKIAKALASGDELPGVDVLLTRD